MTDHPPTMHDSELLCLSTCLDNLARQIPVGTAATASHYLAEADCAALIAAKAVVDRLYRWTHWPTLAAESGSYLPAPALTAVPAPQQYTVNPFRMVQS